jgi:Leucine-rich repeat (LRR) protein
LFPSSLKTLYLQQNEISNILQPRNLNFLENLTNINLN